MKKLIIFLGILFLNINVVKALDIKVARLPDVWSENYVIYNLNDDKIVLEKNKDEITSIASLTKIMSTLVAIENIEDLTSKVTINYDMLRGLEEENAATIGLKVGDKVSYEDLLYCSLLSSGADCTRALALTLAKDEKSFVEIMNNRAAEMSLEKTVFINTTGLDEEGQASTVEDVAIILKTALKNTTFKKIFETESHNFADNSFTAESTFYKSATRLGFTMNYVLGAKTGYTLAAGRCLASIAYDETNDITYLLVTTNAPTDNVMSYHIRDAYAIYSHVFENYQYHIAIPASTVVKTIKVKYANVSKLDLIIPKDVLHYADNNFDYNNISYEYEGVEEINYNREVGSKLGNLKIYYYGEYIQTIAINLNEKLEFSMFSFIKSNILIIGIVIILLYILARIHLKKIRRKRKTR